MASEHEKGKRLERQQGKWLLKNDGECDKWGGMASSTGRVGHITELQVDLISKSYAGEAKNRSNAPKWLFGAWKQIVEKAEQYNKDALLVVNKDARTYPVMHVITTKRHAELLEIERKYKEVE